ncbi:MAG: hypothetical protein ABJA98_10865 [Acidobacteriota bacterium]
MQVASLRESRPLTGDRPDRSTLAAQLRRALVAGANTGGGWGYYPGKTSRIEPTCWALLALAATSDEPGDVWRSSADVHLQFLARSQRSDGLLLDLPPVPNLGFNGLAALVCQQLRGSAADALLARLVPALVRIKGISVKNTPNPSDALQGWPWIEETFSWVEPTALCLLALKRSRRAASGPETDARVQEAEHVLLARSCATGGWNYGNASVYGQDLRPYVPTTALGLMALADRRADPVVIRGLEFLRNNQLNERSGMALALTALCLRIHGLPCDEVEHALTDDLARVHRLNNLHIIAMVLYALSGERHGVAAFAL